MRNVFWLRPALAGRSGPDQDPWDAAELAQGGIGAVLTVGDGELVNPEDFAVVGIEYRCLPLSNAAPPRPGDVELCCRTLPQQLAFVRSSIAAGRTVMVHCTSGKDRTGMFMSYYLAKTEGLSTAAAIDEVKRVRPIALTAAGWDPFTRQVLAALCG